MLNEEQKKQRFKASILTKSKFATDEGVGQEDVEDGEAEAVTAIRVSVIQTVKRSHQEDSVKYVENYWWDFYYKYIYTFLIK